MICQYCGFSLSGMGDSRLIVMTATNRRRRDGTVIATKGARVVVCRDVDECNTRLADDERRRNSVEPR